MVIFVTEPGRPVASRVPDALRNRRVKDPEATPAGTAADDEMSTAQTMGREHQKRRLQAKQAIEEYQEGPSEEPDSQRPYLPVERLLTRVIQRIPASMSPAQALQSMESHGIHHLVVENQGELAGLIDMRWLLRVLNDGHSNGSQAQLAAFELPAFLTATPDTDAHELARQMLAHGLDAALVLDNTTHPSGVITSSDYLRLYAEARPHEQRI